MRTSWSVCPWMRLLRGLGPLGQKQLEPCYSKCGPWLAHQLQNCRILGSSFDLLNQNFYFNRITRQFLHTVACGSEQCFLTFDRHFTASLVLAYLSPYQGRRQMCSCPVNGCALRRQASVALGFLFGINPYKPRPVAHRSVYGEEVTPTP